MPASNCLNPSGIKSFLIAADSTRLHLRPVRTPNPERARISQSDVTNLSIKVSGSRFSTLSLRLVSFQMLSISFSMK
jgi:hypothetical protein